MKELNIRTLFMRIIGAVLCLVYSVTGMLIAFIASFDGEWDKAIFGLVLMFVADYRFDRLYEQQKRQDEELTRIAEEAELYRKKVSEILSEKQ